jgi:hypothetical protein
MLLHVLDEHLDAKTLRGEHLDLIIAGDELQVFTLFYFDDVQALGTETF